MEPRMGMRLSGSSDCHLNPSLVSLVGGGGWSKMLKKHMVTGTGVIRPVTEQADLLMFVFIFYSCFIVYPNFSGLRQHPFIISWFLWVRSWALLSSSPCWGSFKATGKVLARLCPHLELKVFFQTQSDNWQHSVPKGCKMGVLSS